MNSDNSSCVLLRIGVTSLRLDVLDSTGCSSTGSTVGVSSITPDAAPLRLDHSCDYQGFQLCCRYGSEL